MNIGAEAVGHFHDQLSTHGTSLFMPKSSGEKKPFISLNGIIKYRSALVIVSAKIKLRIGIAVFSGFSRGN